MIKGKKSESEMWAPSDMPFWIIFGVVLGFVAIFFLLLVSAPGAGSATIMEGLEDYVLIDRFLKSAKCFAMYDTNAKITHTGILDFNKFSNEQLNTCMYGLTQENVAFRLTLSSKSIPALPKIIKTKNWNDNKPIEKREQPKSVVISYSKNLHNGELSIELQNVKE